jgi:nucleotide-binding universal stress UspA family protein
MRVLVATDGSTAATRTYEAVAGLSLPAGSAVRIVSVLAVPVTMMAPTTPFAEGMITDSQLVFEMREHEQKQADAALSAAQSFLQRAGVEVTTELREGDAASEILACAKEFGAELLVVASKGHSALDEFLLGSVSRNVAKHAKCPVLVVRGASLEYQKVLLAVDISEHSRQAAEFLARLPLAAGAEVTALHVVRPYAPFPGILPTDRPEFETAVEDVRTRHLHEAQALVTEAGQRVGNVVPVATVVRTGNPAEEVLRFASEWGADLLIVGARGTSLIEGLLVGSVADRVLKDSQCSTIIVH